jgi:phage baseplate assembly protein W
VVVSDRGQKLFGALLQNLLDAPQNEEGSHVVVRAVAGGLYVDVAANRDG